MKVLEVIRGWRDLCGLGKEVREGHEEKMASHKTLRKRRVCYKHRVSKSGIYCNGTEELSI